MRASFFCRASSSRLKGITIVWWYTTDSRYLQIIVYIRTKHDRHFADDVLKWSFLNKKMYTWFKFHHSFIIRTRLLTSHQLFGQWLGAKQGLTHSLTHVCVTRLRWVKKAHKRCHSSPVRVRYGVFVDMSVISAGIKDLLLLRSIPCCMLCRVTLDCVISYVYQALSVECMSKMKSIATITFHATYGTVLSVDTFSSHGRETICT